MKKLFKTTIGLAFTAVLTALGFSSCGLLGRQPCLYGSPPGIFPEQQATPTDTTTQNVAATVE